MSLMLRNIGKTKLNLCRLIIFSEYFIFDFSFVRSNDSITVICRIGDFCNWMDARTIAVDSTSGSKLFSR